MNYIKIIDSPEMSAEARVNEFLKEVDDQEHRVMATRFFHYQNEKGEWRIKAVVVVNSEPHPHKKKQK